MARVNAGPSGDGVDSEDGGEIQAVMLGAGSRTPPVRERRVRIGHPAQGARPAVSGL